MLSWALDLVFLLNLNYKIIFTQANDFSDLRGETRIFEKLFGDKAKFFLSASENPLRAMTHYVDENKKTEKDGGVWCVSNHSYYGV